MASALPPNVTSLTYPGSNTSGSMMQLATPGLPGSPGGGPIDMNALYAMMRYKAQTKEWEARQRAALQEREMAMREQMQRAQMAAMTKPPEQGGEGSIEGPMQALALRKARGEQTDADSIRGLRKTPVSMGIYGTAYDWDTRQMNPLQQRAVSPQNAGFANEGMSLGDDQSLVAAQGAARFNRPAPGSLEDFMLRTMFKTPPVFEPAEQVR